MMQLFLYSLTLIFSFIFLQMHHPLSMGLILLIQTIMVCCITGLMTKSFWFSYILFLIFIGGMLVLFIYMTSLASNEMFSLSMKMISISITSLLIMTIMIFLMDKTLVSFNLINNEMNSLTNLNSYFTENSLNLIKLYNYPSNMITILLVNYLLITMIASIKITKLFYGPIRSMN
uniref:NADH-ubiquinone oxidoreductase chain 6 n=1 Tax=Tigridemyia acanthofemurilis TaxID=2980482 RepID=A0A977LM18_9MUSC|nr:NADH dehydrogenase subunit 6 [Tigridemyia acanthofemurilis]QVL28837.1 NADH dehydrogenase subunit 6 [Mallota vilis]UXG18974.1 NADH dehydrogenase subunit 6 [Tigridemyia acanthofemurilis]